MNSKAIQVLTLSLGAISLMLISGCCHRPTKTLAEMANVTGAVPMQRVELTNGVTPAMLEPDGGRFTLGPGDRLDIEVIGETNSLATTIVAPDGKLYYSILPGIEVWGLTLGQAKDRIEEGLSNFVRNRPQVALHLRAVESKRFWVLGRVQAPGVYPLATPTTLLEAISLAGGTLGMSGFANQDVASITEELADLRRSFVIREGRPLPVDFERLIQKGDMSQNIYLQPDDFVYLPGATAREIYVLGAVGQARPVAYKQGMTVAQAIASAYGTVNGAYMHHVALVRGSLHKPEVAIIDYKNVIRGLAPDIELQPQDIVYVPYSPYRYLHRYIELVINTFVSSTAINAGTRAIDQPATGAAGVFIPVGSGVQVLPPIGAPPIR
jgi:protein involved in polysaccharide export with SLBB domain